MRYKVTVAYDGSEYEGWQTQRRNTSIEEAIEKVLYTIHHHEVNIVGSGRTDSGVHAKGQVFHFDSELDIPIERMKEAMNTLLDDTIRIQKVEHVADDFHARFDAVGKRYEYFVSSDMDNPFVRKYMDVDYYDLDIEKMKQAANIFLGTHDFTSFTSAKIDERKDRVRTITLFEVDKTEDITHFVIEGDGFLRYMIRMMVQTIIMVGKGKLEVQEVQAMLEAKDKHMCRYKANACGLYLVAVKYEGEK